MRFAFLLCLLAAGAAGAAHATSVVPPRFAELVAEAELIVRATPIARETRREAAPDGTAILRTYVTLAVERTLKGTPADRLTLAFLGGELGDEAMTVRGVPRLEPGSVDYIFIAGNGRVFCPVVGLGHGRFRVLRDDAAGRDYLARENHEPLTDPGEVGLPLDPAAATLPLLAARAAERRARALAPATFEAAVTAELRRGAGPIQAR
ncbi:MAG: hypothetical protein RLZZ447_1389 [Verrucomicrobiota bacterium]